MSMVGADVHDMSKAAQQLRAAADELEGHSSGLTAVLGSVGWIGNIASRFLASWTGQHRTSIASTASFFRDAAQKLEANAKEQHDASSSTGGADIVSPGKPGTPTTPGRGGGTSPGRYDHGWSPGENWMDTWDREPGAAHDRNGFTYNSNGNCTSFVAWRLNQLGLGSGDESYRFTNSSLTVNGETVRFPDGLGDAGTPWWTDPGMQQFKSESPQVGSVIVFEHGDPGQRPGHVAIVTEVRADGTIVIEESMWGQKVYGTKELGPGQYPNKFLNLLP